MDEQRLLEFLKRRRGLLDGVTVTGGEPLLQWPFVAEVLRGLPGVHPAIETSGYAPDSVFREAMDLCSLILMDWKVSDPALHKKYTGVGNEIILANFEALKNSGKPYRIRTPLIPNITDTKINIDEIEKIIGNSHWETLPYNAAAGAKYKMLGMEYGLND